MKAILLLALSLSLIKADMLSISLAFGRGLWHSFEDTLGIAVSSELCLSNATYTQLTELARLDFLEMPVTSTYKAVSDIAGIIAGLSECGF